MAVDRVYEIRSTSCHAPSMRERWVTIEPSGHRFEIDDRGSILQGGLKAGIALAYGCSNGTCGKCRARLISGDIENISHSDFVFKEAEKAQGLFLMCTHTPATDELVLEAQEAENADEISMQWIDIRVRAIEYPSEHVAIVRAQTPRSQRLRFLAGQTVRLTLPDKAVRRVSLASCPCDDRNLEFHISRIQGERFSASLFDEGASIRQMSLVGPHGNFTLRHGSTGRTIFIAEETGFGPVRSLIEHAMSLDEDAPMSLYWSARQPDGHYLANLCRAWADALDDFRFEAVGGDPEQLIRQVANQHPELGACNVYAAGSKPMLEAAARQLTASGLPSDRLYLEEI